MSPRCSWKIPLSRNFRLALLVAMVALLLVPALSIIARTTFATTTGGIVIKSNSDFRTCGCVTGGSGTKSDPFVISGLKVVTTSATGILVDNSAGKITDYFVITGDTISGGNSKPSGHPGVEFIDVNGLGVITGTGNTFNGNLYGIYLLDSENIVIDGGSENNGATANNNAVAGVAIVGGGSNTVENMQVNHNGIGISEDFFGGGRGIELNSTSGNTVSNVVLSEDSQAGLAMFSSSDNVVTRISVHYPDFYGVIVDGGSGNTIRDSDLQSADYVALWVRDHSSGNLISGNFFNGNGPTGHEVQAGIVPYFTSAFYISSGASKNSVEKNDFPPGNTGGSIIQDDGTIVNGVTSPVQSNNAFNDPSTGNEPSSNQLFPSGPAGSGNYFCGNTLTSTQGVPGNPPC